MGCLARHRRAPDGLVVRADSYTYEKRRYLPSELLLAVEFVSPTSTATDWITKRREYEKAGIPHYWIFDVRPGTRMPGATILKLADGVYQEQSGALRGEGRVVTTEPVALDFPLSSLTAPR